jgi:hypothetical protein
MGSGWMSRSTAGIGAAVLVWLGVVAGDAWGAVTPGWECVPTAAGKAVVSGGTGSAPSCGAGTTAVLAPTYVSSGVGGKPTVVFSTVNVQVVSGSGSTSGTLNGRGNLVVGYAENANGYPRYGSNDLVVGANGGWKGYGEFVGGEENQARGNYVAVFGASNVALGADSSVTGGVFNLASDPFASVTGGCNNVAGTGSTLPGLCSKGAGSVAGGHGNKASATGSSAAGGDDNTASGQESSVTGGDANTASGQESSVTGGDFNTASGPFASVTGGFSNAAKARESSVTGGVNNAGTSTYGSVLGGCGNTAGTGPNPFGGSCSFVSAGQAASVSGGSGNTSSGTGTSLLGGLNRTLSGPDNESQAGPTTFAP